MVVFHILLDINMHELPVIKLQWRAEHLLVWNEKGQKTLPGEALRRSWPEECVELPDHSLCCRAWADQNMQIFPVLHCN